MSPEDRARIAEKRRRAFGEGVPRELPCRDKAPHPRHVWNLGSSGWSWQGWNGDVICRGVRSADDGDAI